jgi:hypothetical protein
MKKFLKTYLKAIWVAPIMMMFLFFSCKKDQNEGGKGAPTIERLRLLAKLDTLKAVVHRVDLNNNNIYDDTRLSPFDSTAKSGALNTTYAIIGTNLKTTKTISINGKEVYFNPTLVTDQSVLVNTGDLTPYGPGKTDELILTTKYGSVTYKFPIKQPAPNILSFAPLAAGAGDIITINGTIFENLIGVKFGTTPAEIVGTPTKTEIKVKVPAGIVQAFIFVETAGGVSKSVGSFGFKRVVFDDLYATSWSSTGYNSATTEVSSPVKRGTKALRCDFIGGYGAYRAGYNGAKIDVAALGLTALKISIYGGPGSEGKKINISLNNNYDSANRVLVILKEGAYTDFTIPLNKLGSFTSINEIILQEYSGFAPSTIYIDDIGFI